MRNFSNNKLKTLELDYSTIEKSIEHENYARNVLLDKIQLLEDLRDDILDDIALANEDTNIEDIEELYDDVKAFEEEIATYRKTIIYLEKSICTLR